ncbi:unnamed protein product [Absidia cylindrospora]
MNPITQHDQQQQQSLYSTRLLSESLSKRKKLFSFLSDRNTHTGVANSTAPFSKTNTTSDDTATCPAATTTAAQTKSPLVHSVLDDSDSHFLRKSLSKFQNKVKQRQDILKQNILPWFRNKQQAENMAKSSSSSTHLDQPRLILLRWWGTLLSYVQHINYTERSLYFECIVEIMARSEFIPYDNTDTTFDDWYSPVENTVMANRSQLQEYKRLLMSTLRYAIEKLNHKAIYSNMISFCAKILAFGFIKIPGLATSLMRLLPIQKTITNRLVMEMGDLKHHVEYKSRLSSIFPGHLQPIMVWNLSQYKHHLRITQKQRSPVASTGNWIRRWQSDDSELFFSFYRHYHVALKTYVTAGFPSIHTHDLSQRNTMLAVSPGYLYLASYFAGKIDALLHCRLHSVTTFPQQPLQQSITSTSTSFTADSFNVPSIDTTIRTNSTQNGLPPLTPPKDTQIQQLHAPANDMNAISLPPPPPSPRSTTTQQSIQSSNTTLLCQPSGKPPPLEMATQRYGECLVWCVMVAEPMGLFHDMINVWIRTTVKTTSMMAVESVFCLLDFIDVVILETQQTQSRQMHSSLVTPKTNNSILQPLDLPFLLYTLQLIFLQSDHAITLLRALSFVYTNFDFLVPSSALLEFMCSRILLATPIFERLLLHWNRNIRTFFLRCLIWRIGRTWNTASVQWLPITQLLMTSPTSEVTSTNDTSTSNKPTINWPSTSERICDGNDCWKALTQPHDLKRNSIEQEQKDYIRCSIRVHILLETLLDSFQQRYLELNQHTHDISEYTAATRPDRTRFYAPNFPSSSLDSLFDQLPLQSYNAPSSRPPDQLSYNNNVSVDEHHQKQNCRPPSSHRENTPLLKRHHLFARPHAAISTVKKDKWMKLFSFATSTSTTTVKSQKALNQHQDNVNDTEHNRVSSNGGSNVSKLGKGYYHQVSDVYTWKTLPTIMNGRYSNNANQKKSVDDVDANVDRTHTNNNAKTALPQNPCSLDKDEDTETEGGDDDDDDDDNDSDRDDGTIDTSPAPSSFVTLPATYIQTAKTWRYTKANHVYATKTLDELNLILNEYFIWAEKIPITRILMDDRKIDSKTNNNDGLDEDDNAGHAKMNAPELTLDWPKNWSYSQF